VTNTGSGASFTIPPSQYHLATVQLDEAGSFRWQFSPAAGCSAQPVLGSGSVSLPFSQNQVGAGDTGAFSGPARVTVRVTNFHSQPDCKIALYNPENGQLLDSAKIEAGASPVTLDLHGNPTAYLHLDFCAVQVAGVG
jgi:hypothetical protein